ncbi:MAG: MFS transporter [Chloroflexi bacterium]|nr:MFS transporter [Chloroflexota bacterium]
MAGTASKPTMGVLQRYGAALRHPQYRRFWASATMAGAGVWGLIIARGALTFKISDESAMAVGLVTFAAMIPFVLVPPFSGILADKMDRRHLVAAAHAMNVVFALMLAGLFFYGDIHVWHLVALSLLSGIARGVQLPASGALVPNLVPREDLLNAIALNNISLQGSRLLGGIFVSAVLGTSWGVGAAFLLAVGMYVLATLAVLSIRTPSTGQIPKGVGFWTTITAGLRYAYHDRPVGWMLALLALHCGFTMAFESVFILHAKDALHQDASAFAMIIAVYGAGAVVGVFGIAGIRDERIKGRLLLVSAIGSSLSCLLLAYSGSLTPGLGAAFLMGLTQAPFMSLSAAFIQAVVPDAIRGRVSSLFTMAALSLMALANLGYGYLADVFGSVVVLAVPPAAFLVVIAFSLLGVGTLRRIFTSGFTIPVRGPVSALVPGGASH